MPLLYGLGLVILAFVLPSAFALPRMGYLCDFFGVIAAYVVCLVVKDCRLLHWMAAYYYPVFLLHEPLIGRCTDALLREVGISSGVVYIALWFALVMAVTLCVIWIMKKLGLNKVLWEFEIKNLRGLRT